MNSAMKGMPPMEAVSLFRYKRISANVIRNDIIQSNISQKVKFSPFHRELSIKITVK